MRPVRRGHRPAEPEKRAAGAVRPVQFAGERAVQPVLTDCAAVAVIRLPLRRYGPAFQVRKQRLGAVYGFMQPPCGAHVLQLRLAVARVDADARAQGAAQAAQRRRSAQGRRNILAQGAHIGAA